MQYVPVLVLFSSRRDGTGWMFVVLVLVCSRCSMQYSYSYSLRVVTRTVLDYDDDVIFVPASSYDTRTRMSTR